MTSIDANAGTNNANRVNESPQPVFTLRNVFCEYSLNPPNPISEKVIKTKRLVPTLHIFGISDEGPKVCLHVHGVLPYVMFRVGPLGWSEGIKHSIKNKIDALIQSEMGVERTGNARFANSRYHQQTNQPDFVHTIELIHRKTMYGYTEKEEEFARVNFLNPIYVNKVLNAIDKVIDKASALQPFEAHIPYHLQFFIDYAIFGMDLIHLSACRFRIGQHRSTQEVVYRGKTVGEIRNDPNLFSPLPPITSCAIEIDITSKDILNPVMLADGKYSLNPGIDFIWREEEKRCEQFGTQIKDPFKDCMGEERPRPVSEQEKSLLTRMRELAKELKERRKLIVEGVQTQALNETILQAPIDEPAENDEMVFDCWTQPFDRRAKQEINDNGGIETEAVVEQRAEQDVQRDVKQEFYDEEAEAVDEHYQRNNIPNYINEENTMNENEEDELRIEETENAERDGDVEEDIEQEMALMTQTIGQASKTEKSTSILAGSDDEANLTFEEEDRAEDIEETVTDPINRLTTTRKKKLYKYGVSVKRHKMLYTDHLTWVRPKLRMPLRRHDYEHTWKEEKDLQGIDKEVGHELEEEENEGDLTMIAEQDKNVEDAVEEDTMIFRNLLDVTMTNEAAEGEGNDDIVYATQEIEVEEERYAGTQYPGPSWRVDPEMPSKKRPRTAEIRADETPRRENALSRGTRELSDGSMLYAGSDDSFNISDYNEFFRRHASDQTTIYVQSQVSDENPNVDCESEIANFGAISLELFCYTTDMPMPDSDADPITAAAVAVYPDACRVDSPQELFVFYTLPIMFSDNPNVLFMNDEKELIESIARVVKRWDPELLIGYETRRQSWGYLFRRSKKIAKPGIFRELSRYIRPDNSTPGAEHYIRRDDGSMSAPGGRSVIDVWKIVRKEGHFRSYDRATAALDLLRHRFPIFDDRTMSQMVATMDRRRVTEVLFYMCRLAVLNVKLLLKMNWFLTTAEMARVYGIQLHEVLTRGSQYRIESMMLRLAHSLGYIAPSVTKSQRRRMILPEQIALLLDPVSRVYFDPVIVLDFQSLYPSMAIAYNYCSSTLIGKVHNLETLTYNPNGKTIDLGALKHDVNPSELIRTVADRHVHCTPQRSAFVTREKRLGIIPTMLQEILATRFMVKAALKQTQSKKLARILDARQLAMKLVANTTYGYTAANWTGRMPCPEVADAMLGKGRETLERAIEMVKENSACYDGARVIYGDTDSLFIHVPGATLERAFELGKQIAVDVTNANPAPVVLKFEKVYVGCVLESKKRYAGLVYEKLTDKGKIESKGIETVRRDTCPIVAKILEHSMRLIFERRFQRLVVYLNKKLMSLHELPYSDFIFCKEYRPPYSERSLMPQCKIVNARLEKCPAYKTLRGERVPYIIVEGPPTNTVYQCVRSVSQFIGNKKLRINIAYYTHKHILAALQRVTDLIPIQLLVLQQRAKHCFTPSCHVIGQRPLCTNCAKDVRVLRIAIDQAVKEGRACYLGRMACQECRHSTRPLGPGEIEECGNHSCIIRQSITTIERNPAQLTVEAHELMGGRGKLQWSF